MNLPIYISQYSSLSALGKNSDQQVRNLRLGTECFTSIPKDMLPDSFGVGYWGAIEDFTEKMAICFQQQDAEGASHLKNNLLDRLFDKLDFSEGFDLVVFSDNSQSNYWSNFENGLNSVYGLTGTDIKSYLSRRVGAIRLLNISGACASGVLGLAHISDRIRAGDAKRVLLIASELSNPLLYYFINFASLGVLTSSLRKNLSELHLPFAANRSGFVKGDGIAFLVLERKESSNVKLRSAQHALDSGSLAEMSSSGAVLEATVLSAINKAGFTPNQIDLISSHGTGTVSNDRIELDVYRRIFKNCEQAPYIHAMKSQIGHCLFASSLVEIVSVIYMLESGFYAPNLHSDSRISEPMFSEMNRKKLGAPKTALKVSIGFGGYIGAAVFSV